MSYKPVAVARAERYKISVDEYGHYTNEGYLIVRGLVAREDVEELKAHAVSIIEGRVDVEGVEPQREDESLEEACRRGTRIHMLHRRDEPSERFLVQPRILDADRQAQAGAAGPPDPRGVRASTDSAPAHYRSCSRLTRTAHRTHPMLHSSPRHRAPVGRRLRLAPRAHQAGLA